MAENPGITEEQKAYLEGFLAAIAKKRGILMPDAAAIAPSAASLVSGSAAAITPPDSADPTRIHREAQDRCIAAGGALVPEELAKRARSPFDIWDEMRANVAAGRFPKGLEIFFHKFHGLFYVAPNQDSFMLRLRLQGGLLSAHQAEGLSDIAERFGGGYLDVTTRANLQIREIGAGDPLEVLTAVDELGLTSRGSGADNIRNPTGSPTAGIDAQEIVDTRPLTRELYHYILNHRELYGLPRKFNIAFDGGGRIGVLEETNDIGFAAVRVGPGQAVPEGAYFRMLLGGITGHGDIARDSGVLLTPAELVPAAAAILRVFIDHGDRTDRKKARLKYLIERRGLDGLMAEAETHLPFKWRRFPVEACGPRGPIDRQAHIGVHAQAQPGLFYIGVVLPVGRLLAGQLRGLADIARRRGSGDMRLTVWQNLLVADIPEAEVAAAVAEIEALGLGTRASAIRAGLVACTGNAGCKFALSDTKTHAMALADSLDQRLALDQPINIHLTGCPNSCAQHYVGDIGLLGTKVEISEDEEVEGYHVSVGGGSGAEARIGRDLYGSVTAAELPARIEAILRGYLAHRHPGETFHAFSGRHEIEALKGLFAPALGAAT